MKPIQPPLGLTAPVKNRPRRRPDLSLPLPPRDVSLDVLLPLQPTSGSSTFTSEPKSYSDLVRGNRIGSGAGGTFYKVVHRPTSCVYALKIINGNHDDTVRRQICREIEILRDVNHPNVVKCHEMFDHNGEIQVLLEFMDKGSLEGAHVWNEEHLSDLSRQILKGLAYLHGRHVVHRAITPSNLLINSNNNVKIADFGVSRVLAQTLSSFGTLAYMSPETFSTDLNQGMYDGCAGDIWSFGVSVLEFFLGRFPFSVSRQGDWASLICAICMSQPPKAPATASPEFRHFVSCCLQREPARRLTALELLQHPFVRRGASQSQNLRQLLPPPH
ncbi:hypothetical protein Bca4012_037379 [Brassica carinata]